MSINYRAVTSDSGSVSKGSNLSLTVVRKFLLARLFSFVSDSDPSGFCSVPVEVWSVLIERMLLEYPTVRFHPTAKNKNLDPDAIMEK